MTPENSSYLLELQHSQIDEVGSEYEVTQNGCRTSLLPKNVKNGGAQEPEGGNNNTQTSFSFGGN
jgi:hypothetical protein